MAGALHHLKIDGYWIFVYFSIFDLFLVMPGGYISSAFTAKHKWKSRWLSSENGMLVSVLFLKCHIFFSVRVCPDTLGDFYGKFLGNKRKKERKNQSINGGFVSCCSLLYRKALVVWWEIGFPDGRAWIQEQAIECVCK